MRKPQRKRSKLSEETFRHPEATADDTEDDQDMNGHASGGNKDFEMPLREKRSSGSGKRGTSRLDSSTILV